MKYLQGSYTSIFNTGFKIVPNKELYVQNNTKTKILEASLGKANPNCLICNPKFKPAILTLNFTHHSLKDLLNIIFNHDKKYDDFSVSYGNIILYEESEYLDDDERINYTKTGEKTLSVLFENLQAEIKISNNTNDERAKIIILHDANRQNKEFKFLEEASKINFVNEEVINQIIQAHDEKMKSNKNVSKPHTAPKKKFNNY